MEERTNKLVVHSDLIICGSIALDRIMNFSGRYSELINPDKLHVLSVSILLDNSWVISQFCLIAPVRTLQII